MGGGTLMVKPCPFCGAHLSPVYNGSKEFIIARHHGKDFDCLMSNWTIGEARVDLWERRAVDGLRFSLGEDGYPVFGDVGEPATVTFLNYCFDYFKKELTDRSK